MSKEVLAVQVPAPCRFTCKVCRTPTHEVSDVMVGRVFKTAIDQMDGHREIYLTSNGETGRSPIFHSLIRAAKERGIMVSDLDASKAGIVPGLARAEISMNKWLPRATTLAAIKEAKSVGVPFVLSVIDDESDEIDPERLAYEHGAAGVIVRAQQNVGLATFAAGTTLLWQKPGTQLGLYTAAAYRELQDAQLGYEATCIDFYGAIVPTLRDEMRF